MVAAIDPLPASSVGRTYQTLPYVAVAVDAEGLRELEDLDVVSAVHPDTLSAPTLTQSIPRINADDAQAAGFEGDGTTVAVIDDSSRASIVTSRRAVSVALVAAAVTLEAVVLRAAAPWAALVVALACASIWVLSQPMEMRGTSL